MASSNRTILVLKQVFKLFIGGLQWVLIALY